MKNVWEYHDLFVQAILLADEFEKLLNMCLEIYELDTALFFAVTGFAFQAALKKTKVKLDLLTDIDMLLTIEQGIRGGTCHPIYCYAKISNEYIKDFDKNKK